MDSQSQRLLLSCMLLISWAPAHAYLDPGTGSALIQGLIAAVAALGVTLKLYWHRIMGFFRSEKVEDSQPSNGNSDEK